MLNKTILAAVAVALLGITTSAKAGWDFHPKHTSGPKWDFKPHVPAHPDPGPAPKIPKWHVPPMHQPPWMHGPYIMPGGSSGSGSSGSGDGSDTGQTQIGGTSGGAIKLPKIHLPF